jgi:uncharacterized protein (UPF0212 family)
MVSEIEVLSSRCPECGRKLISEYIYDEHDKLIQKIIQCSKCFWIENPAITNINWAVVDKLIKEIKSGN